MEGGAASISSATGALGICVEIVCREVSSVSVSREGGGEGDLVSESEEVVGTGSAFANSGVFD